MRTPSRRLYNRDRFAAADIPPTPAVRDPIRVYVQDPGEGVRTPNIRSIDADGLREQDIIPAALPRAA